MKENNNLKVFMDKSGEIKSLEDFEKELPNIPTLDLAIGFAKINEFRKKIKKVRDKAREELVGSRKTNYEDGRILKELETGKKYLSIDKKGNIRIKVDGTEVAKVVDNTKITFNTKKAKEILKQKGIYEETAEVKLKINENKKMYEKLVDIANSAKNAGDKETFWNIKRLLNTHFEIKKELSQKKIKEIIEEGKLDKEEIEKVVETKNKYSLYT
ncbi:hypothetical protein [Fuchsiella alkaliacetigena]|uniref:hypothetical protein n=1 Tax=Fuchsiella alkaliacetigena TaxID=957042 RepID=UPI002009FA10|nr:hypothetical protein [Fuchsiella alkaliacetigena]MCK8826019.1 hypothetical protein [Fuchsiella alkaliacetigena]